MTIITIVPRISPKIDRPKRQTWSHPDLTHTSTPPMRGNHVEQPKSLGPPPIFPNKLTKNELMCRITPYKYACNDAYKSTQIDCERKPFCMTSYSAPVIVDGTLCQNCEQREQVGSDGREGRVQEPTLFVDILEVATDGTSDVKASLVGGLRQGAKVRVEISLLGGGS